MITFDPAKWIRDLRAASSNVSLHGGSLWIEVADIMMPIECFTKPLLGHPERRDAIKVLALELPMKAVHTTIREGLGAA